MNKPICFYHSVDLDGLCSGAIINSMLKGNVILHGINYGEEIPWHLIIKRDVFMVDFCLQPFQDMQKLKDMANSLVWIDHHKSAIQESHDNDFNAEQYLDISKAACEICYEQFFGENIPRGVKHIGRFDIWDHTDPETLIYQYGARYYINSVNDDAWDKILKDDDDFYNMILNTGEIILKYEENQNKKKIYATHFYTTISDHPAIAANVPLCNSKLFDSLIITKNHILMPFYLRTNKIWNVSLYSNDPEIDCSVIAKEYGGGGHRGAAGFQCKELPFDISIK